MLPPHPSVRGRTSDTLPTLTPRRLEPYDISPLEAEFGWTPRPLKQAVADYVSFLRSQPAASL